jgi:hypothetical protein
MKNSLWALVLFILLAAMGVTACGGSPLTFSPAKLPEASAGQPYQDTVTISGNKTPVANIEATGNLPPPLRLTHEKGLNTALISGTPTAAGNFKFTVNAWCEGTNSPGQGSQEDYELVVR